MPSSIKYTLPISLRKTLKEPIGMLVDEKTLFDEIKEYAHVVSIGDQITYTLLTHEIKPWFCVIDYQIKRQQDSQKIKDTLQSYGDQTITVANPAGTLTNDLWNQIKNTYQTLPRTKTQRIEVTGEEDLAALPAILYAPENVTIIYGMPDKGVVIVPSTDEHKQKVKKILTQM
ncbi:MAG: DUF359 domain-containing protein [Thermoplasmatota archaeon]